jgi:3D (Asp-Asp-Asp) domain-containing protein
MIKRIGFISIALIMLMSVRVKADYEMPTKIRCTCYTATEGSITASGEHVREGIVAGKREWLGKVAILYDLNMNIIGIYEFKDTGAGIDTDGDGKGDSIKKGKSIDVYRDTLDECYEWIRTYGDYVLMMIVDAEG